MIENLPAALLTAEPPPALDLGSADAPLVLLAGVALILAGAFATLRAAMWQSHPGRVLSKAGSPELRGRLEPLLSRVEPLITSARMLEIGFGLLFTVLVMWCYARKEVDETTLLATLATAAPALVLVTHSLPQALARRFGDSLLLHFLPAFHALQLPIAWVSLGFEALRRALGRVLGLEDDPTHARQIVEGLREVIADSAISGDLDETEREIIGNVMEFRDVDVAAVMTPRTEIHACDVQNGVAGALETLARSAHSRIPVYKGSLDTIIGTVSARDLVQLSAAKRIETADLRSVVRQAHFVPETKRVSELFDELRRQKIKHAVVLDEYGGTAGLVTMGDILTELVGELRDEFDPALPSPLRELGEGVAEVNAGMHVSEVNEALDLDIPEEADFETLGGFVLAELGHFPQLGEHFRRAGIEYSVVDANDRRVLTVRVRRPASQKAS